MNSCEIINNKMNQMSNEIAKDNLNLISVLNNSANIIWTECFYEDLEVYWAEVKDYNMYLLFQFNVETNEMDLYIEDKDTNSYYCFSGRVWREKLCNIYTNMNTVQYDNKEEPFQFIEDINYDSEILGEIKPLFKPDINYNQEMLG